VRWTGADAGGIEKYLVWVKINDEAWQPWLETTRTDSQYVGAQGNVYAFAVWAVDNAGNWSLNTDLQPQTFTVVR
jgi:spore coat protein CotH